MPKKLIQAILDGASLSTVMTPDPAHPSNQPEHDESYRMRFVYFSQNTDAFFAQTYTMHRPMRTKITYSLFHSFCYSVNHDDLMMIHCSDENITKLTQIRDRYSKFRWVARKDFATIWDSKAAGEMKLIRQAIAEGRELKLAVQDEDGLWTVLPVDLLNIDSDRDLFSVRTETGHPPACIPNPDTLCDVKKLFFDTPRTRSQFVNLPSFSINIFFCCFSDGSYYTYFDENRIIKRRYQHLKLFSQVSANDTEEFTWIS